MVSKIKRYHMSIREMALMSVMINLVMLSLITG